MNISSCQASIAYMYFYVTILLRRGISITSPIVSIWVGDMRRSFHINDLRCFTLFTIDHFRKKYYRILLIIPGLFETNRARISKLLFFTVGEIQLCFLKTENGLNIFKAQCSNNKTILGGINWTCC